MVKKNNIVSEYIECYNKYKKLFGNKTVVLMQVGSFHEAYCTNDKGPNLQIIGEEIDCFVTRKNKKSIESANISNPFMMGVPSNSLEKYLNRLIDKNYTIIVIDQVTPPPRPKRKVTGIYSQGTNLNNNSQESNNILSIYLEESKDYKTKQLLLSIGFTILDLTTGKILIHNIESSSSDKNLALDELCKILSFFNPKEIIINTSLKNIRYEFINNYCELNKFNIIKDTYFKKEFSRINYQNELIERIWKVESQLSGIEYFHLENLETVRISLIVAICFSEEHNSSIINNLDIPKFYGKQQYLKLGNDAITQLDLIKNKTEVFYSEDKKVYRSLFDIINNTHTGMGKRFLYYQMLHPLIDTNELQNRYKIINNLLKDKINFAESLKEISDIEKLSRKMSLGTIHPREMFTFINSLSAIKKLLENSKSYFGNIKKLIKKNKKLLKYFEERYLLEQLQKYLLYDIGNNIFKDGCYKELDKIMKKKKTAMNMLYIVANNLSKLIENESRISFTKNNTKLVRVEYSDKYGYHFEITKKRFDVLKKKIKKSIIIDCDEMLNYKDNKFIFDLDLIQMGTIKKGNNYKINSLHIDKLSTMILGCNEKVKGLCREYFMKDMQDTYKKYSSFFMELTKLISFIDFINSGVITAKKFNYTKPNINNNENSFIDFKNLRHPIVERIIDTEYITHDLSLGKEINGILLFGLNSAGKSTIMKAIGLNVILAQMGYFVACKSMNFSPYQNLLCRISGNDNIFKGLSSFHLEINELDAILNRFNKNTLVLADEVCRGTENSSALIIVATLIKILAEEGASFLSATHLHDLIKLEDVKNLQNVEFKHLEVNYDYENNMLVYDRLLKDGNGPSEYGLEVASFLMKNKHFIDKAKQFKKDLLGDKIKTSKYNKKVFMDKCEICLHKPKPNEIPLETHHIRPQKDTDAEGFVIKLNKTHLHKNNKSNLVTLCSKCHDEIDRGNLYIYGYLDTSKGMKLVSATKNIHNELVLMEDKPSRKKTKLIKDKFGKKLTVAELKFINECIKE